MSYGPTQVFSTAIASGASTAYFDLGGKSFKNMAVFTQSMTTGGVLTLYGSPDNTTYKQVWERVNTATCQHQVQTIATATSGNWVMFAAPPFRYIAFACDATVAGGGTIKVAIDD